LANKGQYFFRNSLLNPSDLGDLLLGDFIIILSISSLGILLPASQDFPQGE
jgi:hypothetical protein